MGNPHGGTCIISTFLPHPAGGKAASQVGPKVVLAHVCVYIYNIIFLF